jgi:predicted nucleic acid-binding protein
VEKLQHQPTITAIGNLRAAGRMLSEFDLVIAAVARQVKLTLLTADQDFQPVLLLQTENWL